MRRKAIAAGVMESAASSNSNIYLDSLLWLTPTNPFTTSSGSTQISYYFAEGPGPYEIRDSESSVDSLTAAGWNSVEQAAALQALVAWTSVANISLTAAPDADHATFKLLTTTEAGMAAYFSGEAGVLGFSTLPNDYSAYPYGPGDGEPGYTPGFAVFNNEGDGWTASGLGAGGYGYVTLLHEIGHLFGLDHPFYEGGYNYAAGTPEPYFPGANGPYKTGTNGLNQGIFTTMTYNDGWSGEPSKSLEYGWQMGPMAFDIAAMQKLYGANMGYETGNNTYTLFKSNAAGTGWLCLWDAGGQDTIKVPDGAGASTIDLRDAPLTGANAGGYVSWVKGIAGGFTIAHGAAIENAVGGAGADKITGNALANKLSGVGGNDIISALAGNDILCGGAGCDVMSGGAGADAFVFKMASESIAGAKRDAIQDFQDLHDHIDLRGFDANSRASGVQQFDYIGTDGFHGIAGELRFAKGILAGDVNGDRRADFEVSVSGVTKLDVKDFFGVLA